MNAKEIGELRRRMATDKNRITKIYGCFVNQKKEIISTVEQSVALMPQSEAERYFALLKKCLSGTVDKNLISLEFSTQQVVDSPEHRLLMELRDGALADEEKRTALYQKIIEAEPVTETPYLILLAYDAYDVPYKGTDEIVQEDSSETVFRYFLCGICPVKESKTELGYVVDEKSFHNCTFPQTVAAPEYGFLFPCFDDRATNIYNVLLYSRSTETSPQKLIDSLFQTEIPLSPIEQKETFQSVLADSLQEDCQFDVLQTVHEQIREAIEQHKESRDPEPLDFGVSDVTRILEDSGVPEEKVEQFRKSCDREFGDNAALKPGNLIDVKKFRLETPEVKITVSPDYSATIETRIIDGKKYILISADEGVVINGINVTIKE